MKNERDVKKKVKAILDKHGWFWWMPPANAYGKSGISDIHAVKRGVFIVIETKFGGNKPTALQVGFLNSIRAEQCYAFVVDETTVEFLDQFLESFALAAEAQALGQKVPEEHGARMLNAIYMMTRY